MAEATLIETPTPTTQAMVLDVESVGLTDEQFERLCRDNRELRLELTAEGKLIIMLPAGSETGRRNGELTFQLVAWAKRDGSGIAFDSSTGFTLPNGAKLSPDASWIRRERWEALTEAEREKFAPLCPDFVAELRSKDDSLAELKEKMEEYLANGARLGWLIDPKGRSVYVWRPGQPVEHLKKVTSVSGDPELPRFVLDLREIW
jgi:Uma2 family endonuclease